MAEHNPELQYQVQDDDGKTRTLFLTHPGGNRAQRRRKRRHLSVYTKNNVLADTRSLSAHGEEIRQRRIAKRRKTGT